MTSPAIPVGGFDLVARLRYTSFCESDRDDKPGRTVTPRAFMPLSVLSMEAMSERESAPCQICSTEFDWNDDECPHCGWDKQAWVENGRYWLQTRHAE